jgi:hypothetical protein
MMLFSSESLGLQQHAGRSARGGGGALLLPPQQPMGRDPEPSMAAMGAREFAAVCSRRSLAMAQRLHHLHADQHW